MPRCPAPNTYLKTDDAVNGSYSNNVDLHYYGTQIYDMWQSWMNLDVGAEMNKYAGAQGGGGDICMQVWVGGSGPHFLCGVGFWWGLVINVCCTVGKWSDE